MHSIKLINSLLEDPQMMQKIMSLAQNFQQEQPKDPAPAPFPEMDPGMLQQLLGFAQQSGIDQQQQALLQALRPYLAQQRLSKLERAMQAARMAGMATTLLPNLGR